MSKLWLIDIFHLLMYELFIDQFMYNDIVNMINELSI